MCMCMCMGMYMCMGMCVRACVFVCVCECVCVDKVHLLRSRTEEIYRRYRADRTHIKPNLSDIYTHTYTRTHPTIVASTIIMLMPGFSLTYVTSDLKCTTYSSLR